MDALCLAYDLFRGLIGSERISHLFDLGFTYRYSRCVWHPREAIPCCPPRQLEMSESLQQLNYQKYDIVDYFSSAGMLILRHGMLSG